jgi:hypothetical protein
MLTNCLDVAHYARSMGAKLDVKSAVDLARSVHDDINRFHTWNHRRTEGQIAAVADYTTGTVSISQGSTAATFSGATLTAAMITRHIQIGGSGRWYAFYSIDTGAGTAVLADPWEGSTVTGEDFIIRQRYYRLPPDFDKADVAKESGGNQIVWWRSRDEFEMAMGDISASGNVQHIVPAGATTNVLYETGTVTLTFGSATMTGSGTTWTQARDEKRRVRFPLFTKQGDFTAVLVNSTTDITLSRVWREPTVSSVSYQIDPVGEPLVELYPSPGDGNQSLRFYYFRTIPPLYLETEVPSWSPELSNVWKQATTLRALTADPEVWHRKFSILMSEFMKRNGYEMGQIVRSRSWGTSSDAPPSNLPWNYPARWFAGGHR